MAISKFPSDALVENTTWGGDLAALQSLWFIKRALEYLICNEISPFWSFYDYPFHKNLICPRGIAYNPCTEGFGGGSCQFSKTISRPPNYAEQNGNLIVLSVCVLGINGRGGGGGGLVAIQSLLINTKYTSPFNFQSNEPFLKFLRRQMSISKFLSDAFRENTRCEGVGVSSFVCSDFQWRKKYY